MELRVLITGAGTGGHIYPLVAVAEAVRLRAPQAAMRYIGPHDVYTSYVERAGVRMTYIAHAKLRRYWSFGNLVDGPKFAWSIAQAYGAVRAFKPHVAFSKGGPGSLAVAYACKWLGVPLIIHESDAVPGLSNRAAGAWARLVELGWAEAQAYFPGKETRIAGVPIRTIIAQEIKTSKEHAKKILGLNAARPALLVIGGSQGSERINHITLANLPALLAQADVIHQTGSEKYAHCMALYAARKKEIPPAHWNSYRPYAYLEEKMGLAYAAADCVVSRAGSALFEVAAFGIPSVVIPLPEAAGDHQLKNARGYEAAGACVALEEKYVTDRLFVKTIGDILGSPQKRAAMSAAARAFAKPDAAERIAEDIVAIGEQNKARP